MKKYGENLKAIRLSRGLKTTDIMKATGISTANLSRWEQNKIIPTIYSCELLADFYGISLDELIGRDTHYTENDNYTQNNIHGNNTMHVTKNYNK